MVQMVCVGLGPLHVQNLGQCVAIPVLMTDVAVCGVWVAQLLQACMDRIMRGRRASTAFDVPLAQCF